MTARTEAIARITRASRELAHVFAFERSTPLLAANLTMPQLKILLVLSYHDGSSGQELSGVMGVSLATITGIVDRLVAQDLVTRREDPHDRRIRRIVLTRTGQELVDGIINAGMQRQRRVLQRLDDSQLMAVARGTELLLEAARADAAATAQADAAESAEAKPSRTVAGQSVDAQSARTNAA